MDSFDTSIIGHRRILYAHLGTLQWGFSSTTMYCLLGRQRTACWDVIQTPEITINNLRGRGGESDEVKAVVGRFSVAAVVMNGKHHLMLTKHGPKVSYTRSGVQTTDQGILHGVRTCATTQLCLSCHSGFTIKTPHALVKQVRGLGPSIALGAV
jgi:hypothetical protein